GLGEYMVRSRIFVSHSHEDDALCRPLVAALRRAGADVWCDERSHAPGPVRCLDTAPLREPIQTELLERPICIIILSSAALACERVREDCDWACDLATDESDRRVLAVVAAPYNPVELDALPCLKGFPRVEAPDATPHLAGEAIAATLRLLDLIPPERVCELIARGAEQTALYRFEAALDTFDRAIDLTPNNAEAWVGKGTALARLERYYAALEACDRALALA